MALANTHVADERRSLFTTVIDGLARIMENHPQTRQLEKLNRMSDEELAARGVTRHDVIRHIFRDRYYL